MNTGRHNSQPPPPADEKQMLLAGWLVDGGGGPAAADRVIVIRKGRVQSVEPCTPSTAEDPRISDLRHATILPALMDAHVHLAFSGTLNEALRQVQLAHTPQRIRQSIESHLRSHLDNGIVAVRDGGDRSGQVLKVKALRKTPVHLAATCWAWHAQGRYGAMIGRSPDPGKSLEQAVARSPHGLDHIKLIQSGINSLDRFGHETAPQFSDDDLAAVRQLASRRGLPVMVHANGRDAVRSALAAGCDSVEHGYFMGSDNMKRMAEQQVFWVPTAIPMAALARDGVLDSARGDTARRTLEHQLQQIALAHRSGVRIALGTDAGSMGVDHGAAVRGELALLMQAGLSLPQAVKCATFNTAALMGLKGRGVLQPGRRADLIVVQGSPDQLPASLENIAGLCIDGRWWKMNAPLY